MSGRHGGDQEAGPAAAPQRSIDSPVVTSPKLSHDAKPRETIWASPDWYVRVLRDLAGRIEMQAHYFVIKHEIDKYGVGALAQQRVNLQYTADFIEHLTKTEVAASSEREHDAGAKLDFSFAAEAITAFLKMGVCPAGYDRDDLRSFCQRLNDRATTPEKDPQP